MGILNIPYTKPVPPTWVPWLPRGPGMPAHDPSPIHLLPRETPPIYSSPKPHLCQEDFWETEGASLCSPASRRLQPWLSHSCRHWPLSCCYLIVWVWVCVYFFPQLSHKFTKGRDCGLNFFCSTLCKYSIALGEWINKRTLLTLAMVETNNIITVAMWTTKIPASNTNILAFWWLKRKRVLERETKRGRKRLLSDLMRQFGFPGVDYLLKSRGVSIKTITISTQIPANILWT